MIPPPLAIPLASPPLPLTGERLSSFPPSSATRRIWPYTASATLPLCDTLASGRRGYKRPTRQRKRGQRFAPLCYATRCVPTSPQKRPQRARQPLPRPLTRPSPSNAPSAPIRGSPLAPATGPPLPTGPPPLATGPPCARNAVVIALTAFYPLSSAFPAIPEYCRLPGFTLCDTRPRENRRQTYIDENAGWSDVEKSRQNRRAPSPPTDRRPRMEGIRTRSTNPPRNSPHDSRRLPA